MSICRFLPFRAANFRAISSFRQFFQTSRPIMATLEKVIENNKHNEEIIASIKHELKAMRGEIIFRKKQQLRAENAELLKKVNAARNQLISLEMRNGKTLIQVPGVANNVRGLCTDATSTEQAAAVKKPSSASAADAIKQKSAPAKEKKPKKKKATTDSPAAATTTEAAIDVGRLDMRVGKIIEVGRHPDADTLYLEKIDCGEAQPRTVVSGLVKFVPLEEMQNRMVVVMCNLKPAKMRGVTSEAMVMCASTPDKVEVLSPPANAVPGDLVHCEGYTRQPDAQLNPKKKIFETCAPDLMTNEDLIACYKGAVLHVPGKGNVIAQTLKNVNVK